MLKLITTAFGQKNTILVTNTRSQLGKEILRQLSQYPHLDIKAHLDANDEMPALESISTIIHLPSNNPDLLAEIVGNTSTLHQLLTLAKSNRAKFVLVIPSTKMHLYQTAMQLVIQFGKNYQIPYHVFEAPTTANLEETAESILKKIVFRHKNIPAPVQISHVHSTPKLEISEPKKMHKPEMSGPRITLPTMSMPKISLPKFYVPRIKLPQPSLPKVSVSNELSRWMFLVFAIFITPWTIFIISNAFLIASGICAYRSLQSNHIARASSCAQASRFLQLGSHYSSYLAIGSRPLIGWAGFPIVETDSLINSASQSLSLAADINAQAKAYVENALGEKENTNLISSTDLKLKLTQLVESLANLQNDTRSFYAASSRPPEELNALATKVIQLREIASNAQLAVGDIMPLFESSAPKRVAIILQDNTEMRPSGGYIDSVLLLTIENAKITGWRVVTTQVADQQLLGTVETPADLRIATGQLQWFLRDSNWDIDFRKTASKVSWFIQKELNETPDIVLAMNMSTLSRALPIVGPIKMGLSGVVLSENNIYDEYHSYLKTHADNNDFIKTITEKMLDRTKTLKATEIEKITSLLVNELNNNQIYVGIPDRVTAGIDMAGWGGGVIQPKCRSALICVVDYISIIDSNIGINKSDFYTERSWTNQVNISETGLQTMLTGVYKNTSTENAWPSGIHKNYLRVVLPGSTLVETVKIGERELKKNEISVTNENNLAVIGFTVETLPGSTSTIVISTTQNMPITTGRIHYQLNVPHQAGRPKSTQKLTVKYPERWFATSYQQPAFASAGELEYNLGAERQSSIDLDLAVTQ